jgi:hypothetical protein
MIITAYKSEEDGKIFEDKKKYQNHLRKLARVRRTRRQLAINEALHDAVWNELYEREQSIEQWRDMVIAKQDLFWAEAAKHDAYDWSIVGKTRKGVVCPVPRLLEFTEFRMHWNDKVSNSHSCPHNGVTCWSSNEAKDGRPRGYPGWQGRAEWIVAWPKEWDGHYLGGDLFSGGTFRTARQRAHTGTGGGGGMRYSEKYKCHVMSHGYDFKIFAADWPGMARYHEKRVMWKTLSNKAFA